MGSRAVHLLAALATLAVLVGACSAGPMDAPSTFGRADPPAGRSRATSSPAA